MNISYAITVHNEGVQYLKPLLDRLNSLKREDDEIVVIDDISDDPSTLECLNSYQNIHIHKIKFQGNFSDHKNQFHSLCNKDYIFQLDADELPNENLIKTIGEILYFNPEIDLYYVPRINLVPGISEDDIKKWGWRIDEVGKINFPDYQGRIYKRLDNIRWEGKVHERITGTEKHAYLPYQNENQEFVSDYCLMHVKNIERQKFQNSLYNNLINPK